MGVIWTGRDPLEIARLEAQAKGQMSLNEIMSRESMFNAEQAAKQESPESMLAQAKLQSWGMMSPEEQKQTMGVKSPIEMEMQKAQLTNLQQEPGLREREMGVREDQLKRMADQFSQTYGQSQEELKLRQDAFQQKIDENAKDNFNKQFGDFTKLLGGLGSDKVKIGQAMEQFMAQNTGIIQDPRITPETAIALGTSLVYGLIANAKQQGLDPAQVQRLKAQAQAIQGVMRQRASETESATRMFTSQKALIDLATAEPEKSSWLGNTLGWAAPTAAGLGGLYGYKKLGGFRGMLDKAKGLFNRTGGGGKSTGGFPGGVSTAGVINPLSMGASAYLMSQDQGQPMQGYSPASELGHGRAALWLDQNKFGRVI